MDLTHWTLLFFGGIFAGIINTLAGGGSLISLPLLMLLGLSPNVANGTNRLAVLVQSGVASWQFHRNRFSGFKPGLHLLPSGLLGALIGAYYATQIDGAIFQQITGYAIVPLAALTLFKGLNDPRESTKTSPSRRVVHQFSFFFIGLYAGFLQAGVGLFALAVLGTIGGMDLRLANAIKLFTVGVFALLSLWVFIWQNAFAVQQGLVLALAAGIGGYLGSKIALKKGGLFIRVTLVVTSCFLAYQLLKR